MTRSVTVTAHYMASGEGRNRNSSPVYCNESGTADISIALRLTPQAPWLFFDAATMPKSLVLAAFILQIPAQTFAQPPPSPALRAEFGVFGGGIVGVGNHGNVGGYVGGEVKRERLLWLLEFSYSGLDGDSASDDVKRLAARIADARLFDVNTGLHLQFRTHQSGSRLIPYLGGGVGMLHSRATVTRFGRAGSVSVQRQSDSDFAGQIAAGLRWLPHGRIGLRPEVKIYIADQAFVRFSLALFWRDR